MNMKFEVDTSAIDDEFKRLGDMAASVGMATVNDASKRLLRSVRDITPVGVYPDRVGGTLRRAWQLKIMQDNTRTIGEIFNNTEYGIYVEAGHRQTPGRYVPAIGKRLVASWVEGKHMLQKSVDAVSSELPAILRKNAARILS